MFIKGTMNLYELVLYKFLVIHYKVLNSVLNFFAYVIFGKNISKDYNRILVFRTGSLGDSVCALPAINSIRKNYPKSLIDILTNAGAENRVSLSTIIDQSLYNEIIDYLGLPKKELLAKLKQNKYDLFIQLPQYDAKLSSQIRDIIFAKAICVKFAFGWRIGSTRLFAKYQEKMIYFENERDRLLNILTNNKMINYGLSYSFGTTKTIQDKIKNELTERNILVKANNIGMVVGSNRPQNSWPILYFKDVADDLLERGINILLFGGQNDVEKSSLIAGNNVFNFCGKCTPLETAELMKYCNVIISNDTGPMHLAYAVGTPVIAIFSGRDYSNKWFPPADNITLRVNNTLCVECNKTCKKNNECLRRISSKNVLNHLKDIIMIESVDS